MTTGSARPRNAAAKVMSSNSTRAALEALQASFEKASGRRLAFTFDPAKLTLERIARGERADLAILNTQAIDDLASGGVLVGASRVVLARCGVGVAVRAGAHKPDIGSVEAFRKALLDAASIAHTESGASGMYFAGLIDRLGVGAEVRAKAKTRPGGLIGELVVAGEAELAVQQIPELLAVPGIALVGPLPEALQSISVVSAALFAEATEPDTARAFVEFLRTPEAVEMLRAKGMDPA